MLVAVLVTAVIAFGFLIAALLLGNGWLAGACVAFCVLGLIGLAIDTVLVRRRSRASVVSGTPDAGVENASESGPGEPDGSAPEPTVVLEKQSVSAEVGESVPESGEPEYSDAPTPPEGFAAQPEAVRPSEAESESDAEQAPEAKQAPEAGPESDAEEHGRHETSDGADRQVFAFDSEPSGERARHRRAADDPDTN